jgi:NitT/TauT family transport system substrate-binding protein
MCGDRPGFPWADAIQAGEAQLNTRSFRLVPFLAAAIMVLASGCAAAGSDAASTPASAPALAPALAPGSASAKPEEPDITVAAIPAVDLAGLYIAQDQGFFAQQGLHVTIVEVPSSQAILADQLKGQVDISAGSYVAYLAAEAAGARFRVLAEASILQPGTRVLVTTGDSRIMTIGQLTGRKIGVNGVNSIGLLLISALLSEHGIRPGEVDFVTDQRGFPAMPGQLQDGDWDAAFLAEPYITVAGEEYGEKVLADLDQGAMLDLPVDGYVATRAWAAKYPHTAAAFVRAVEEGQTLANSDPSAVQVALAKYDKLPLRVTAAMVRSGYPVGPVDETGIQRVADAMLQFGLLGREYAVAVEHGTLVASMVGS